MRKFQAPGRGLNMPHASSHLPSNKVAELVLSSPTGSPKLCWTPRRSLQQQAMYRLGQRAVTQQAGKNEKASSQISWLRLSHANQAQVPDPKKPLQIAPGLICAEPLSLPRLSSHGRSMSQPSPVHCPTCKASHCFAKVVSSRRKRSNCESMSLTSDI